MNGCEQFAEGTNRWNICMGLAPLPEKSINAYRERWGMDPLEVFPEVDRRPMVHSGSQQASSIARVVVSRNPTPQARCGDCASSRVAYGPGTELTEALKQFGVPPCHLCRSLAERMNSWGVGGCRERIDLIVSDMRERARQWLHAEKPWIPKLLGFVPMAESAEDASIGLRLRLIINQAIDSAETRVVNRRRVGNDHEYVSAPAQFIESVQPVVTITTVVRTSARAKSTLQQTLDSMQAAGFETPTVIWDVTQSGPFWSFCEAARAGPDRTSGWILICEDDVVFRDGTADYIRAQNLQTDQILSLYCSSAQDIHLVTSGWSRIIGDMHGSLAYLIHASTLQRILDSDAFKKWRLKDRVDRVFCKACQQLKLELLVHRPSLAQHIGETSTLSASRKLDKRRTSENYVQTAEQPAVTLITPTGDRPEQFDRCQTWMARQKFTGQIQWIIVDDGHLPTKLWEDTKFGANITRMLIRTQPLSVHSLCRNLKAAYPHIQHPNILIIEDDDYYGPDYVSAMVGRLTHADLVGEFGAKYYHLPQRMWRHNLNEQHASLCRTGFTRAVLPEFWTCINGTNHPSVDLRLWSTWAGSASSWTDPDGTSRMCVGLKGGPGRQSYGHRPRPECQSDPDGVVLRRWLGPDAAVFHSGERGMSIP